MGRCRRLRIFAREYADKSGPVLDFEKFNIHSFLAVF